jgi:hypothetical protein
MYMNGRTHVEIRGKSYNGELKQGNKADAECPYPEFMEANLYYCKCKYMS